jgi:outer membrane protein TolC
LAAGALACAAQPSSSSTAAPAAPSLAQAVDAAWLRSAEATQSRGWQQQARADRVAADSWLSAAPALQLAQRNGRGSAADGQRETEVGLALPLWQPGARATAGQAADAEQAWSMSAAQAARLRVAGQVRESLGQLHALSAEHRLATQQRELLGRLADDVERRVRAGDLAPADALAARAEWLAGRAQEAEASLKLGAQKAQWQLLTGLPAAAADPAPLPAADTELDDAHPELQLAARTVERAQRRLALLQAQRGDGPELGVSLRQERPGQGNPLQHSVGVALRLPFGTTTPAQPRLAAARAEVDLALTEQQRTRERLAAELAQAQAQLQGAQAQASLERQRASLLRERAAHIDKAFRAGEAALPELLRALAAAAQADTAAERQQAQLQLAQARLQQAQGLLP